MAKRYLLFAVLLLAIGMVRCATAARTEVYSHSSFFKPGTAPESLAYVTPTFELEGRAGRLELVTTASVDNAWAYFDYALVNEGTGTTYEFGREVSYYHGTDSDGRWTEGSQNDRAVLPSVPAGQYFLRVQPQGDPASPPLLHSFTLRRDVPLVWPYVVCLLLLGLPPLYWAMRTWGLENARWRESDYAPESSDGEGDDDDE